MLKYLPSISALLIGYAILITGNGLFGTLVSLLIVHGGFSSVVVGVVQSSYYVGFLVGTLVASNLIARIGHHRAFSVFAAIATCAALGHPLSEQPAVWIVLRLAAGFCMAGIYTAMESWLNAAAPNQYRGQIFSLYLITNYLGTGGGQVLLKAGDPYGFELFSIVGALFAISLVPVTLTGTQIAVTADSKERARAGIMLSTLVYLYRTSPLGVWGCITSGLLHSTFNSMAPVYMSGVGYSVEGIARFMALAFIAGLVLQWPSGRMSDRYNRSLISLGVSTIVTFLSVIVTFLSKGIALELIVFLYVSVAFTLYGVIISDVNDSIAPEHRIAISAALLLFFSVGGILGPTFASMAMEAWGPKGLFIFTAMIAGTLACFLAYGLYKKRARVLAEANS